VHNSLISRRLGRSYFKIPAGGPCAQPRGRSRGALFVAVRDGLGRDRAALLTFPGDATAAAERETPTLRATPALRTELVHEAQLVRHRVDLAALGEHIAALECLVSCVSSTANKDSRCDGDERTDDEWTQYSHGGIGRRDESTVQSHRSRLCGSAQCCGARRTSGLNSQLSHNDAARRRGTSLSLPVSRLRDREDYCSAAHTHRGCRPRGEST
jgi:hypothetical protein